VAGVQSWVPPVDPNDTAVYAVHTSGPEFVPTNERCFIHTIAAVRALKFEGGSTS
jgi:hypothetical protein